MTSIPHGQEWDAIMAPDQLWETAYPILERHVRTILADVPASEAISTQELMSDLYPESAVAKGTETSAAVRTRMFNALSSLAKNRLQGWWTPGSPKRLMGRNVTPKLWHQGPHADIVCPACKRLL